MLSAAAAAAFVPAAAVRIHRARSCQSIDSYSCVCACYLCAGGSLQPVAAGLLSIG